MGKYLVKRILHSLVSIIIVVGIVMVLIYSLLDRQLIFAQDPTYTNLGNNAKVAYTYRRWEEFGYIDYVPYAEWLQELVNSGELTAEERDNVVSFARKEENDSDDTNTEKEDESEDDYEYMDINIWEMYRRLKQQKENKSLPKFGL